MSHIFLFMLHNLPLKYTPCVIIRHVIGSVGNIKIGTEVVHTMTRTPLSRSKGQGHQAALLTAVLARQAAAVVGVRTCWPWKIAATLPSAWRAKRFGAWEERGGGIPWRPSAYSLFGLPVFAWNWRSYDWLWLCFLFRYEIQCCEVFCNSCICWSWFKVGLCDNEVHNVGNVWIRLHEAAVATCGSFM